MSRRTATVKPDQLDAFITALAGGSTVTAACKAGRMAKQTAYDWRQRDEDFAVRWADAVEEGTDALEDEAHRRAMETSDSLLMFLLKARRPDKFRDKVAVEHSGQIATPSAGELAEARRDGLDDEMEAALAAVASLDAARLRRLNDGDAPTEGGA